MHAMRYISALFFLISIAFSDLVLSVIEMSCDDVITVVDISSETESESEAENEVEQKKEAQIGERFASFLVVFASNLNISNPGASHKTPKAPNMKIPCPPPDLQKS